MHWNVSGNVQGSGIVMISYVLSNRVTGSFSTNGGGDYYDTNVSLVFVPDGQASGDRHRSCERSVSVKHLVAPALWQQACKSAVRQIWLRLV